MTHANVEFTDNRIPMAEWPNHKPTMPNQQIPCLELADGTKLGQTIAILRMLGSKYGYYPTDNMEAYKCDSLIDGFCDVIGKLYTPLFA